MTNKEIRKMVRMAMVRKGDNSLYSQARLAKKVLEFDPIYGDLSMTTYSNIDYNSFLTALQQMSNILNIPIWESAKIVKTIRNISLWYDEYEDEHFSMPPTKEAIEALK